MLKTQTIQPLLWCRLAGRLVFAVALAFCLAERASGALEWDELRGRVLSQYDFRLHWNNITGPPHWIRGVPIQKNLLQRLSTVTLVPGESVELLVPAESFVRAYCPHELLSSDDLQFWVSNGSGLQVQHTGFLSPDGKSLVTLPDHPEAAIVRICRPESCYTPLTVALFVSYRESSGEPVSYRTLACTASPAYALKREDDSSSVPFHLVSSAQPVSVRVAGPARLKIETHLRYPALESESQQSYQLRLFSGSTLLKIVDFETSAETRQQTYVGTLPETLGRREAAYVEIPPGPQELTLDASSAMYFRVLERDRPEWLLGGNRPPLSTEEAESWGYLFEDRVSHWNLTPADFETVFPGSNSTDGIPWLAFRSARDNSRPEGPLRAYFLLRSLAAFRSDESGLDGLAGQIRSRHMHFRDLIPVRTGNTVHQRTGYFLFKHLRSPQETNPEAIIAEQHVDELVSQLPSARFIALPNSYENANVYRLPDDLGSTLLQVIVDQQTIRGSAPLIVQFDGAAPMNLVAASGPELPPSQYSPGVVEAGLTVFADRHVHDGAGTLGGAFAQLKRPTPLLTAGHAELVVPPGVSEIRVWSPTTPTGTTSVALRYLVSKPFRLTEMEYIDAARRAGVAEAGPALFLAALQKQGYLSQDQYAERELRNHWHPLITRLRQEDEIFRRGLIPENSAVSGPVLPESRRTSQTTPPVNELLASARTLAADRQWLPALEAWSEALPHTTGNTRHEAIFGRMTALRNLGEDSLYETGLRGLFLFDQEESIRSEASARLEELYRQSNDEDSFSRLQVVRVMASPTITNLIALSQQLADQGRSFDALELALLLPRNDQVTRLVLRTSIEARWWQHFDQALNGLPDLQEQHIWRARRAFATGAVTMARGHLQQAGPRGVELLNRLQTGEMIRSGLLQGDPASRARGVFDWERWEASSAAPRIWSNDESLIADYESSALLINPGRDTASQSYLSGKNRPVTLIVQGPAQLRIGARPLHPRGSTAPIDDWMIVSTGEQRIQVPINNNHAADLVQFADQPEWSPGSQVSEEIGIGPGRHVVRISGESVLLAVRVERLHPERTIPVLPPIDAVTVAAALTGSFGAVSHDPQWIGNAKITSPGQLEARVLPITPLVQHPVSPVWNPAGLPADIAPRVMLRLSGLQQSGGMSGTATRPTPSAIPEDCSPRERYSLLFRMGLNTDEAFRVLPPAIQEAILWRQGRGTDAVNLPLDTTDVAAVKRRMASFLWLYEHDVPRREHWMVQGEDCFTTHAQLSDLRGIHSRLTSQGGWKQISQIESSAGLRTVPTRGWRPESPFLRVRKSLLGPSASDEQVITGDQALALRIDGKKTTRLECTVQLSEPPYIPPSLLTFAWQLDSESEELQQLTPDHNQITFGVDVPAGAHTLRVRCVEPWVNQFLRVRIVEMNDGEGTSLQRDLERFWHVGTAKEPVIVPVEGPALFRIDELRNGRTINEFRVIPEGMHRLELPAKDGEESLYRVFQLRYDAHQKPPRIKHLEYYQEPPDTPYLASERFFVPILSEQPGDRLVPETLTTADIPMDSFDRSEPSDGATPHWLNVHQGEDFLMEARGIWSSDLGYFSRRPLLEGIDGGKKPDEFFQLGFNHHQRFAEQNQWTESDFLFRQRIRGGQTFGVSHVQRSELAESPWVLFLSGSGYLQHVNQTGEDDWQGSLDLRGRLSRDFKVGPRTNHTPQVTLFGRALSLEYNPYPAGAIDQDVFTTFKRDHLGGLIIADQISHRPWLDTQWWARPALMTNQNFNLFKPDNLSMAFGWEQWIRPVGIDLSYRITGYFEDSDRPDDITQQLITLEGFTEGWVCGSIRCEGSLFLQHKLGSSDNSLAAIVTLTWDAGYNDWHYRPGEMDFQTLRKWRGSERRTPQTLQWW